MILKKLIKCALQCDQKELLISDINIYIHILHLTWPILLKVVSAEVGVTSKLNQIIRTEAFTYHTSLIPPCHADRLDNHSIKQLSGNKK